MQPRGSGSVSPHSSCQKPSPGSATKSQRLGCECHTARAAGELPWLPLCRGHRCWWSPRGVTGWGLASPVRSHPHRDPCRAVPGAGRSLCATATSFRKGQNPQEGEFSDLDSPPWPAGLEEQRDEQAPPGAASGCCARGTGMAPAGGSFSSPGVGRRPFPAVSSAAVPGSG